MTGNISPVLFSRERYLFERIKKNNNIKISENLFRSLYGLKLFTASSFVLKASKTLYILVNSNIE